MVTYINDNSFAKIDKFESIKTLSLAIKLSAFSKNIKRKYSESLDFAREVRNEQSHRNTEGETNEIKAFKEKLRNMGLPLTKEGEVYWKGIENNETLLSKYESIDKSAYWRYRYQLWRLKQPFGNIAEAINVVAQQVESELVQ